MAKPRHTYPPAFMDDTGALVQVADNGNRFAVPKEYGNRSSVRITYPIQRDDYGNTEPTGDVEWTDLSDFQSWGVKVRERLDPFEAEVRFEMMTMNRRDGWGRIHGTTKPIRRQGGGHDNSN